MPTAHALCRVLVLALLTFTAIADGDEENGLRACPAQQNEVIGGCPVCAPGRPCLFQECPVVLPTADCPVGHFCPWGTPAPIPCPSGFVCKTTGLSEAPPCREGFYCPKDKDTGWYTTELPCTKGHFCREYTEFPIECTWGSDCGEGEKVSQRSAAVGPIIVAFLLGLFLIKMAYGSVEEGKNKARMEEYRRKLDEVERESKNLHSYVQMQTPKNGGNFLQKNGGSFPAPPKNPNSPQNFQQAAPAFPISGALPRASATPPKMQPPQQQQQPPPYAPHNFRPAPSFFPQQQQQQQQHAFSSNPWSQPPMFPPLPPNGNAFFQQNTVIGSAFGSARGPPPIQTAPRLGPNKVQNYLNLVAAPGAEKADSGSEVGQTDTFRFQGLTYKRTQINLGFNNVRLQVPVAQGFLASLKGEKRMKPVLKGVTGMIQAGSLTAIMGPSGSGKSSLLNVLTGKASYGEVEGEFLINGTVDDLKNYAQSMGFVPQDDTMLEELTVLENLYYGAQLRLPSSVPKEQKLAVVNDVIRVLGLEHIAHTPVGNVEKRGISGGERKRVNIGLELVADPTLLFLDEPTSGLDSTTSLKVLRALKRFCKIGATVITVIHQPRSLIFNMFDDVVLLKKGGQIVYAGPASLAESYFVSLGFFLPKGENPADWVIDIISGDFSANFGGSELLPGPDELVSIWDKQGAAKIREMKAAQGKGGGAGEPLSAQEKAELETVFRSHDQDGNGVLDKEELSKVIGEYLQAEAILHWFAGVFSRYDKGAGVALPDFLEAMQSIMKGEALDHGVQADPREYPRSSSSVKQPTLNRIPPSTFHVFVRCFVRDLKQKWRKADVILRDIALVCIGAVGLGLLNGTEGTPDDTVVAVLQSHTAMGLLATIIALRAFGLERENRWREAANGLSITAYFFAKALGQLIDVVVLAAFFSLMYHQMVAPRAEAHIYLFVFWGLTYAVTPFGMIFSIIMKPATSMIAAVLFPMISVAALSGLSPRFPDMEPGSLDFIGLFSPGRWSVESNTVFEWKVEEKASGFVGPIVANLMDNEYGFKRSHDVDNLGWLFVMGTAWRAVCFLLIHFDAWQRRK